MILNHTERRTLVSIILFLSECAQVAMGTEHTAFSFPLVFVFRSRSKADSSRDGGGDRGQYSCEQHSESLCVWWRVVYCFLTRFLHRSWHRLKSSGRLFPSLPRGLHENILLLGTLVISFFSYFSLVAIFLYLKGLVGWNILFLWLGRVNIRTHHTFDVRWIPKGQTLDDTWYSCTQRCT